MPTCSDCKIGFDKLQFHHDPPKSVRYKDNEDNLFYTDKDGKEKLLREANDRDLCLFCHIEADLSWGIMSKFQYLSKKKHGEYNAWRKRRKLELINF